MAADLMSLATIEARTAAPKIDGYEHRFAGLVTTADAKRFIRALRGTYNNPVGFAADLALPTGDDREYRDRQLFWLAKSDALQRLTKIEEMNTRRAQANKAQGLIRLQVYERNIIIG